MSDGTVGDAGLMWSTERYWVLGQAVTLYADAGRTAGGVTLIEVINPPRADGPPPHYHNNCEETFHLLEGRLELLRGESWCTLEAGQSALVPRNVVHSFRNPGDTPARFLSAFTAGGFGQFFRDFGTATADFTGEPAPVDGATVQRLLATSASYGMIIPQPVGPG